MQFVPENSPSFPESGEEWCFAFVGDRLLFTATEKEALLPRLSDLYSLGLTPQRKQYIGRIDGTPCFAVELAGMPCPQGMALEGAAAALRRPGRRTVLGGGPGLSDY